jgi:4-hydroxybenzoate polyprenyltransferase
MLCHSKLKITLQGYALASRIFASMTVAILLQIKGASGIFSINVLLFLMLSFLFNDYCDVKKDKLGATNKASTIGLVSEKSLGLMTLATFLVAMVFLILAEESSLLPYLAAYCGSFLYSKLLKPNIPTFATSLWCLVVVSFVFYPFNISWVEQLAVTIFFFARELLLDLRDVDVDSKYCKTKSLPKIFGTDGTLLLFIVFSTTSAVTLGFLTSGWFSIFSFVWAAFMVFLGLIPKAFDFLRANSLKVSNVVFIPIGAYFFI